jgi:methionine-rich copper-binding protein CopC
MRKTSLLVFVFLVAALPVAVSAHLKLTRSSPSEGAAISTSPKQLQLWFNEEPLLPLSSITLKGPDGNVKVDPPRASAEQSLTVAIGNALTPGSYRIAWKAAGGDGHVVTGTVDFTVKEPARPPM